MDGRASQSVRHRWSASLVQRVFHAPFPSLLDKADETLVDTAPDSDPATALRIALLWDELIDKVHTKPTAVLGLLDIANTKMLEEARAALGPILESSANRVVDELPPNEAWDLIAAVAKKVGRPPIRTELQILRAPVGRLAAKDPLGAVKMACSLLSDTSADLLVTGIADSLAMSLSGTASHALIAVGEGCLWKLLSVSDRLVKASLEVHELVPAVAKAVSVAPKEALVSVAAKMLPSLREEYHLPVARPVFAQLELAQVVGKFVEFASTGRFNEALVELLVDRGRAIRALGAVRSALLRLPQSLGRDQLLEATISPTADDVRWLLYEPRLFIEQANDMLGRLLSRASHDDRFAIFRDPELARTTAARVHSREVLYWLLTHAPLSAGDQILLALALSADADASVRASAAAFGLSRALQTVFDGDQVTTIVLLMERAGEGGDLRWAFDAGLGSRQPAELLNRNLEAFDKAAVPCRHFVLENISQAAKSVSERYPLGLDRRGAEALAHLLWDSESVNPAAHLEACGSLLPALLRATQLEVSLLIVAAFPSVYQELGRRDQIPDFLKFMPFYDWNRCKAARVNLVHAFLASSVWEPSHFCAHRVYERRRTAGSAAAAEVVEFQRIR